MELNTFLSKTMTPEDAIRARHICWSYLNIGNTFFCSPYVDIELMSLIQMYLPQFQYVIVEPLDLLHHDTVIRSSCNFPPGTVGLSLDSFLKCDFRRDLFDIIFLFCIPEQQNDFNNVMSKVLKLMKDDSQVFLLIPSNDHLDTLKDFMQRQFSSPLPREGMTSQATSSDTFYVMNSINNKSEHVSVHSVEQYLDQHYCYSDINILPSTFDISALLSRNQEANLFLSALFNIDLTRISDTLYNYLIHHILMESDQATSSPLFSSFTSPSPPSPIPNNDIHNNKPIPPELPFPPNNLLPPRESQNCSIILPPSEIQEEVDDKLSSPSCDVITICSDNKKQRSNVTIFCTETNDTPPNIKNTPFSTEDASPNDAPIKLESDCCEYEQSMTQQSDAGDLIHSSMSLTSTKNSSFPKVQPLSVYNKYLIGQVIDDARRDKVDLPCPVSLDDLLGCYCENWAKQKNST
ncbi:hypothetical protein WA158_007652 [Blastocystis sp. Blastoise]